MSEADALFDDDGLVGGACAACDRRHFPMARWCPWCGAEATRQVRLSTRGTVWAWTAVTAPPPGYEGDVPYGFGVVELADDGLQIVSRLTESDPARIAYGQAVSFRAVDVGDGSRTWAFAPETT